jgi:hypothetical protein
MRAPPQPYYGRRLTLPGLPPWHGVIALGEVDGMARRALRTAACLLPAIPETCLPGEGICFVSAGGPFG